MANVKVGVEGFDGALEKILKQYGDEITEKNEEVIAKVGRKAAKALRQEASAKFNGTKYAAGWAMTTEGDRIHKTAIVYNKKLPGLPHLLEYGHATRGGGRKKGGKVHIKPIEEKVGKLFEDTLKEEL